MNAIRKWYNKHLWNKSPASMVNEIMIKFIKNGFAVSIPRYHTNLTDPCHMLDLMVERSGYITYFRFIEGSLAGAGAVSYMCNLVETHGVRLIVVYTEPVSPFELNVFRDNAIQAIAIPTLKELYDIVKKTC